MMSILRASGLKTRISRSLPTRRGPRTRNGSECLPARKLLTSSDGKPAISKAFISVLRVNAPSLQLFIVSMNHFDCVPQTVSRDWRGHTDGEERLNETRDAAAICDKYGKENYHHGQNRQSQRSVVRIAQELGRRRARCGGRSVQDTSQYPLRLHQRIHSRSGKQKSHWLPR